jgi:CRP-like cAMP-binding protein
MESFESIFLQKDQILLRQEDLSQDLYYITQGKFLACQENNKKITALAHLTEGDYIGELSFFDRKTRSAYIMAMEDSQIIKIPQAELKKDFPLWLTQVAKSMTSKIRVFDDVLSKHSIRKKITDELALSIEEQQRIYQLIFPQ